MTEWSAIRAIPVGGLVAVGFLDEHRVVVGSHSGLGVFDAATGAVLDRVADAAADYACGRSGRTGLVDATMRS